MSSITTWNRLEPRPRSNSLVPSLAARIRDPAWFLCRQWQTGELSGQDAGSPAFITVGTTTSNITGWSAGGTTAPLDAGSPLEKQVMAEPFSSNDLALSVEIGQTFRALLPQNNLTDAAYNILAGVYKLGAPGTHPFDPVDSGTLGFLAVCEGQALDGTALYAAAKQGTVDLTPFPNADRPNVTKALNALVAWVKTVWGDLGDTDPLGWVSKRLEYQVQVQAEAPDATGVVLDAHPDRTGELPWSAFDVSATPIAAPGPAPAATRRTMVPGHVRFRGIASPRFWDFETNELAIPSVRPEVRDVGKVLALDFLLIHGADWFVAPITQPVGTLARVDALVVTDVFGAQTSISRADALASAPSLNRWTMFTPATPTALAPFFVCPPTAGSAAAVGPALESVRFARDDMAQMVWGIENATASPIGRPRPGNERDAAQDQVAPVTPGKSDDTTSPLRYQVETKVPVHWIPFLGVGNPIVALEIAAMSRPIVPPNPNPPPSFTGVPPLGKILNPKVLEPGVTNYQLPDEEVPRDGLEVERVVFRTRWIDGSPHLWIARRRRTGAGETASALRFDLALPTVT
jgi:hypothetical protein